MPGREDVTCSCSSTHTSCTRPPQGATLGSSAASAPSAVPSRGFCHPPHRVIQMGHWMDKRRHREGYGGPTVGPQQETQRVDESGVSLWRPGPGAVTTMPCFLDQNVSLPELPPLYGLAVSEPPPHSATACSQLPYALPSAWKCCLQQ